jgi:hypothetical protein
MREGWDVTMVGERVLEKVRGRRGSEEGDRTRRKAPRRGEEKGRKGK